MLVVVDGLAGKKVGLKRDIWTVRKAYIKSERGILFPKPLQRKSNDH
jgi:hypothetical protein